MNVGFSLLTLFPGRVGGSETYVRGLLDQFARGDGPERVTVLANRHVAAAYEGLARGPVALHQVRSYRPGDGRVTRLAAMLNARMTPGRVARDVPAGIDVLHHPVTVPIPATSGPVVVTLADVQHHDLPALFSRAERRFRRWAYDRPARTATVVITHSRYSRDRIGYHLGVDPERVEVIHHGIDLGRYSPEGEDDEALLAPYELPNDFAVYPANLWPHKNHLGLLRGLAAARGDVALVLTGQAYSGLDELTAVAGRLGIGDRVRHLGFVPASVMPALYRRARALIFPSFYEGFGAPPLEAMACGCPVASSTVASLAEVCGDAVEPIDPEDPASIAAGIERVTGDDGERQRLREAGLAHAARFTWEAAAAGHLRAYERALGAERAT